MLNLRTSLDKAHSFLSKRIDEINKIQIDNVTRQFNFYAVVGYIHTNVRLLETIYGVDDKHTLDYSHVMNGIQTDDNLLFVKDATNVSRAILMSYIEEIQTLIDNPELQQPIQEIGNDNSDKKLLYIFSKFHNAAKILERNRKGCSCFSINSEYDVQLLIYSLLSTRFEHIRVEEPTGSHAGSASKMDFVLDDEKAIIEIKYAFDGHIDKEIGEELLLDIAKYESGQKYSKFFCFIYDPQNKVRNPAILKKDLEGHKKENFDITVIIEPK